MYILPLVRQTLHHISDALEKIEKLSGVNMPAREILRRVAAGQVVTKMVALVIRVANLWEITLESQPKIVYHQLIARA